MKKTAEALYTFWNGFNIPAYPENSIPDNVTLPYISYEMIEPIWTNNSSTHARVYYRDLSYVAITEKVDQITTAIGEGIMLPMSDGYLLLYKGVPFVQFIPIEGDSAIKCAYLMLEIGKG